MQPFSLFPPKHITPAVSSRPPQLNTQIVMSLFTTTHIGVFFKVMVRGPAASMNTLDSQVMVSFCALLWRDCGSLLPYFDISQTSPISFIFQTQGYCQYAQLPPCVSVFVCARARTYVCVCIYI